VRNKSGAWAGGSPTGRSGWLPQVHRWAVGACAAVGFALAWFFGEEAIEILKTRFRWS
jgi:hypothetical protein